VTEKYGSIDAEHAAYQESDDEYRRVHVDLVAWCMPAGPELVRSVMRELGLEPCQPRPWRFSGSPPVVVFSGRTVAACPAVVDMKATAQAPAPVNVVATRIVLLDPAFLMRGS
jgi:hypothetical protein